MAGIMLRAALHRFRRLGFVGALLLALATVALPVDGQVCAPAAAGIEATAGDLTATVQTDPCGEDGCGDCAATCAHGCCHAPHLGVVGGSSPALAPSSFSEAVAAPAPMAPRLAPTSGLERPPRV